MADVFISYHDKTNGDRAEKIAATLENAGITCWYARRDVPAGGDFTHEVIKQIGDCTVFLLLLDEGAARSPHVETEVGNAFGKRKKIMPYQTDKKDIKSVSWVQYYLKQVQIVPLPDYNTLTEKIATALGRPVKMVTPEPQPTELKPEAVTPETKSKDIIFLDGVISTLMFICIIGLSVEFFNVGRPMEEVVELSELFDVEVDNFLSVLSGFLGAFVGCFLGWTISRIFMGFIKSLGGDLYYADNLLIWTLRIWVFIALILGIIISNRIEIILGGRFFFLCLIMAGFIGKLTD